MLECPHQLTLPWDSIDIGIVGLFSFKKYICLSNQFISITAVFSCNHFSSNNCLFEKKGQNEHDFKIQPNPSSKLFRRFES